MINTSHMRKVKVIYILQRRESDYGMKETCMIFVKYTLCPVSRSMYSHTYNTDPVTRSVLKTIFKKISLLIHN